MTKDLVFGKDNKFHLTYLWVLRSHQRMSECLFLNKNTAQRTNQ